MRKSPFHSILLWVALLLMPFLVSAQTKNIKVVFRQVADKNAGESSVSYGAQIIDRLNRCDAGMQFELAEDVLFPADAFQSLRDGKLDLLGCVYPQDELQKEFAFSKHPIGYSSSALCVRKEDQERFRNYPQGKGFRVAFEKGGIEYDAFQQFVHLKNIAYEPIPLENIQEAYAALQDGKADAIVLDELAVTGELAVLDTFAPRPFFFAARKDDVKIINQLDEILAKIQDSAPQWLGELRTRYFPSVPVKACILSSDAPGVEKYCRALLYRLAAINAWELEIVEGDPSLSPDSLGEFDLVCGVPANSPLQNMLDYPPHRAGVRSIRVLARAQDKRFPKDGDQNYLTNARVAFSSTLSNKLVFLQYLEEQTFHYMLTEYPNTEEALQALRKGQVELAISDRIFDSEKFRCVKVLDGTPFYLTTPKSRPKFRESLSESLEYINFYEPDFLEAIAQTNLLQNPPDGKVIRVATYLEAGLAEIHENGTLSGYCVDYLRHIAELEGWTLNELPTNYPNAQKYVAEGVADVLVAAVKTSERQKIYDYSEFDIGPLYYGLLANPGGKQVPNRAETWENARIAVFRGSKSVLDLEKFLKERGVTWTPIPVDDLIQAEELLRNGQYDAVYAPLNQHNQDLVPLAVLPTNLTYICTTKKRPEIIADVNDALEKIHRSERDFQTELTNRYFPRNRNIFNMTMEDLMLVEKRQGRPVYVEIWPLIPPLKEFDSETSTATGFLREVCRELEENTGLQFHFVQPESLETARKRLVSGECDIWFGYDAGPMDDDEIICVQDMIKMQAALIRRQGTEVEEEDKKEKVAIARQDAFLLKHYANRPILLCENRQECYQAVVDRRADFTVDSLQVANMLLNASESDYPALAFQPVDQQNFMLSFPVYFSTKTPRNLRQLLEKSIRAIPPEKMNDFLFKAVFGKQKPFLTGKQLGLLLGLIILTGLIIVVMTLIYYNGCLKKERDLALEAQQARQNADIKRMEQEAASKAKSAFLFNMSHDIRTPMNAITGYTAMAQKQLGNPEKTSDYLAKIEVSSKHLLELINGVLDMSRIESGKLSLNEEPCDLNDIAKGLMTICDGNAKKKHIHLVSQFEKLEHPVVITDALRLNQVVLNILNNAIKYTPEGGTVTITLSQNACEDPEKVECIAVVKDTGIGMSEEFQKKLFEPFSREKNTTVSGIEGTGLGLAIVKHIIDLMGAEIQVQSTQGKGTEITMRFRFPIAREDTDTSATQNAILELSEESLKGKRVLLVEDNEMNREIAREMLQGHRMVVEEADDGDVAVRMVAQNAPGYYAFVLMDVQMPRMNGYDATRAIRKMTAQNDKRLPIIAMTANAFAEDKKNAMDAGMDAHLSKPIHENEVIAMLRRFV